jgi:ribosomal protein S12 methylthiotransferase accessory factor
MEAIEFATAEPRRANIEIANGCPRDVLDGYDRVDAILDFCPIIGKTIELDAPLACTAAEELVRGEDTIVPAEVVLLPYAHQKGTGWFGSSSNGLASGNSTEEATIHGLFEVIERDVRSFNTVHDTARRVITETLPPPIRSAIDALRAVGIGVVVRELPNVFGIPVFETLIWEPHAQTHAYLNGGFGCHALRDVAVTRAFTEAIQSRVSWIHGGRDDLEEPAASDALQPQAELARAASEVFSTCELWPNIVSFDAVEDPFPTFSSLEQVLSATIERLLRSGVSHVCRVRLSAPEDPLVVVRIIVPKLEYLARFSRRAGPRLHRLAAVYAA